MTDHNNDIEIKSIEKKIGEQVRRRRKMLGISQEELGELVDLSLTSISRLENGHQIVSVLKLIEIATALNVEVSVLLQDTQLELESDNLNDLIIETLKDCSEEQKEYILENIRLMLRYFPIK